MKIHENSDGAAETGWNLECTTDRPNLVSVLSRVSTPGVPRTRGARAPRTFFNPETRGFRPSNPGGFGIEKFPAAELTRKPCCRKETA